MKDNLTLSICIPTNGTARWVLPALESIYAQGCDTDRFEVVITDNGPSDELEKAVKELQHPNLTYRRTTSQGFHNIMDALKLGKGTFCKAMNHREVLVPGALQRMLDIVDRYKDEKPVVYFASGHLKLGQLTECEDFNSFVYGMSTWSCWMGGLGIWDIDKPVMDSIAYDKLFPNSSLLFEMRQQSRYVIDNTPLATQPDDKGKGGYNYFRAHAVVYLDILNDLRKRERISTGTFVKVKGDMYDWLTDVYYKEVFCKSAHSYDLTDIDKSMEVYYTRAEYLKMRRMAIWIYVKRRWQKLGRILRSGFTTGKFKDPKW